MVEQWKPVPEWPNYEASDLGRIRNISEKRKQPSEILSPFFVSNKYSAVALYRSEPAPWGHNKPEKKITSVHRLVMAAFVGPCPDGLEVRHLDGNKSNNHLSNLAYGTRFENCQDKRVHGKIPNGERSHLSKLTEAAVRHVRLLHGRGAAATHLGKWFGVKPITVSYAARGKTWAHIPLHS